MAFEECGTQICVRPIMFVFEVENFAYCYEPSRGMVDDLDRIEFMARNAAYF